MLNNSLKKQTKKRYIQIKERMHVLTCFKDKKINQKDKN